MRNTTYALEGSAFIAGAAVQWLRDGLEIISTADETEELAQSVPNSGGTFFVPAFAGLGAPHWEPTARGVFWGITGGTNKRHLVRAVLEGVSMQIVDILDSMTQDAKQPLIELRVDGGMSRNNFMMQLQSDRSDCNCIIKLFRDIPPSTRSSIKGCFASCVMESKISTICIETPSKTARTRCLLLVPPVMPQKTPRAVGSQ